MTPTPPDAGSPRATLRQLKEMLDAGAITPQEFETLKQRLVFGGAAEPPVPAAPVEADLPKAPAPPEPYLPPTAPEYLDTPAALAPESTPVLTPEPDWLAAPAPTLLTPTEPHEPTEAEVAERRNPLNLIFALGGLVLFLAVVAYLAFERRPDEHVTSQSQTAADSTAVAPEVGPQAEQLTLPPATAPETIRVAPAATPVTTPAAPDSAATRPAPTAPAPTAPATRPVPAATPPAPDTTARP